MQNDFDISHINRQIQKNNTDIDAARLQATNQRTMASQMSQEGNTGRAEYYQNEAQRFEQQAADLEKANQQLQDNKQQSEQKITELEKNRATLNDEFTAKLNEIDKELARIRGSGMML